MIEQVRRAAQIYLSRIEFYEFCKTLSPEFYTEDKPHLKKICDTLQALYEGNIFYDRQKKVTFILSEDEKKVKNKSNFYEVCKKLILNIPPQFGKSRCLINFSAWIMGKNVNEKIITCSYNDSAASDFSKYTRDLIQGVDSLDNKICYEDIFPRTKIKEGSARLDKWALQGQHFSYLGSGIGGSVTGKGANILITDDPIKNAEVAFNENELEKIWLWWSSTFRSRVAGGEPIEIVNHTRWATKDVCGRILEIENDWHVLNLPAMNDKGEMLCENLLSKKRFEVLKNSMDKNIFEANYLQKPFDEKSSLFKDLKTFSKSDLKEKDVTLAYIDVADEGNDYLCAWVAQIIGQDVYVTDCVYTKENTDVSLQMCEDVLKETNKCRVESNSMGAMFGRELARRFKHEPEVFLHVSTTNKLTRIKMNQYFVTKYFHFLNESEQPPMYAEAYQSVIRFSAEAKNKNDDAPDALTGLAELVREFNEHLYL